MFDPYCHYYTFIEVKFDRTDMRTADGSMIEDGMFWVNALLLSQNALLAKMLELKAKQEELEMYINDLLGLPQPEEVRPTKPEDQPIYYPKKKLGFLGMTLSPEHGGGGLDTFSMCVALEEMSQHCMGLYNPGCGVFGRYPPPAIWAGSKEQIDKYAVPTIREGWKTFFAITEPSGGSDPAGAIQTRAEKKGDRYVIHGHKWFITGAEQAAHFILVARTSDDPQDSYIYTVTSTATASSRKRKLEATVIVSQTTGFIQLQSLSEEPVS